jgi:hypothetical protein
LDALVKIQTKSQSDSGAIFQYIENIFDEEKKVIEPISV